MPRAKPSQEPSATLQVEHLPIGKVLPYAANPKRHPDRQVSEIMASIKRFGFVNPILIDAAGTIIAGHGRVLAAHQLGFKRVPVIRLGHLGEAEAKALRIADNSIADSGTSWDEKLLEAELASLRAINFELEPLGLDNIELPEIEELPIERPRSNRSKSTIFLSVLNPDYEKARKVCAAALDKARIGHNL
jgi:ParB-like chromosome segregation protein Spo0J